MRGVTLLNLLPIPFLQGGREPEHQRLVPPKSPQGARGVKGYS